MLSPFSRVYFVPSEWRQKNVDSFERPRHGSPAAFYIPNYFQCERFAMPLDAPNPTTNQSSRLTLPTEGATLRFLKKDRQTVEKYMGKLSPCHAEVSESYSKKSIETQWMHNFDKRRKKIKFSPGNAFSGILSTSKHLENLFWPIKTIKQPIHCPMPSLRVIGWSIRNGGFKQLMYSEENRFRKHATENFSRIEVVS